jgi:hypothetical protein
VRLRHLVLNLIVLLKPKEGMTLRILLVAALCASACATTRDTMGSSDSRLDDSDKKDAAVAAPQRVESCGPDGKGDIILLDAASGAPLSCAEVTVSSESMGCTRDNECPAEEIFHGRTNKRGQVASKRFFSQARLSAVADGYAPSFLNNATFTANKVLEIEMAPLAGYWLKLVDQDGNYLPDTIVTFKKGEELLGTLRSNALANVFFTHRAPFEGEQVVAEAEGFQSVSIQGAADLGDDGHTLTLKR